jgi:hypothetical protein
MKNSPGSDGTAEGTTLKVAADALAQRRLFCAERCKNLIQALEFMAAVLHKTSAGGNDVRDAMARNLAESLPLEELEAAFEKIDALWAEWNRPGTAPRNREAVEHRARMALLAAVEQAKRFIHRSKAVRAVARQRIGSPLDAEDEVLIARSSEAKVAAGLLDGGVQPSQPSYGVIQYEREEAVTNQTAADAELPPPGEIVRWLIRENGYPDLAVKLTDAQAERLVEMWPERTGRPRRGHLASWDVISQILVDLRLGGSANVRKDWEKFRRENRMVPLPKSPRSDRASNRRRRRN